MVIEMMKRVQQIVKVKPEKFEEYKRLHANIWPDVSKMIKECNIRNYSIAYRDGLLFTYFEYVGNDYIADITKMAADSVTQDWWAVCKPCLLPVESETVSDCWADMEEVFYLE